MLTDEQRQILIEQGWCDLEDGTVEDNSLVEIGELATALLARQQLEQQQARALVFLASDEGPSPFHLRYWADARDKEIEYTGSALCCFLRDAATGIEILQEAQDAEK